MQQWDGTLWRVVCWGGCCTSYHAQGSAPEQNAISSWVRVPDLINQEQVWSLLKNREEIGVWEPVSKTEWGGSELERWAMVRCHRSPRNWWRFLIISFFFFRKVWLEAMRMAQSPIDVTKLQWCSSWYLRLDCNGKEWELGGCHSHLGGTGSGLGWDAIRRTECEEVIR